MGQRCIPVDSPSEWSKALEGIEHAFAHTWENCYVMKTSTGLETYLYSFQTDEVQIVCPVSERTFREYTDIVTPYGFSGFVGSGDAPEFSHRWINFVKQRGYVCGYINLNPLFENSTYFESTEVYRYNHVYVLDLTQSEEELYAGLSTNRKRQLKDWDKISSDLVLDTSILSEFFLANYHEFFRLKGASGVYNLSRDALSFMLALPCVFMAGAQSSGKVQAVSVFAYTPYVGDYLFNVSLPEGRHHSVALLWYAIKHLKALGVPLLNLGGGIRSNDGVAEFKQRFGGERLALGCLKQVYKPDIYTELCREAGADPTDIDGYFPAYRSP